MLQSIFGIDESFIEILDLFGEIGVTLLHCLTECVNCVRKLLLCRVKIILNILDCLLKKRVGFIKLGFKIAKRIRKLGVVDKCIV